MITVRAENISRHYTHQPVFSELTFQIDAGERIGLVGPNGAGKSTLLRVLLKKDPPDSGAIHFHDEATVAMLSQFPDFEPSQTLLAEAKLAMSHLEQWYANMLEAGEQMAKTTDEAEHRRWAKRYDHFQELLRHHGGYEFDHRIEEILFGLGFTTADFERPLETFSGGQQSRVLLAKLLLKSPDLMLLDEPTNHLDIETTEWLEDYLTRQDVAMVLVSHDRYFLDKTVTKIFELSGGKLTAYPGNYAAYSTQRVERQKVADRVLTKQKETIAHHEDFVRRNLSGQLAKQAKSREKMIARLEEDLVETVADIRTPVMGFGEATRAGDIVVSAREISKAYDKPLFEDFSFEMERGQRIGIIGANGTGKTTLLRILLGEIPPTSGSVRLGHKVKVGYLDQDLSLLDLDLTPLDVVRPPWRATEKAEPFRGHLARFGIGPDLADKKLRTFSGGERTRVALARLSAFEVNFLALDEPTNHLDLWAREALEKSLLGFEGSVLVVSHDRYFLNQVVDRLLLVENGRIKLIVGNYDRFQEYRKQAQAAAASAKDAETKKSKPAAVAESATKKRKRKFPFRKTAEIEADIAAHETRLSELEAALLTPEVYKDGRKTHEVSQEVAKLKAELETLVEHWEEAMELNPS